MQKRNWKSIPVRLCASSNLRANCNTPTFGYQPSNCVKTNRNSWSLIDININCCNYSKRSHYYYPCHQMCSFVTQNDLTFYLRVNSGFRNWNLLFPRRDLKGSIPTILECITKKITIISGNLITAIIKKS